MKTTIQKLKKKKNEGSVVQSKLVLESENLMTSK